MSEDAEREQPRKDSARRVQHALSERGFAFDLFGNRTEVVFERMEKNRAPDEALFRFEPAEDDRVLTLPNRE